MTYIPWERAWRDALYGPSGFFRRPEGPAAHFRTGATSTVLAKALIDLAQDLDQALDEPNDFTIVDVGAGRGEMLNLLSAYTPARWHLIGVDIVDRPKHLDDRITWLNQTPERVTGLLLAHELLDATPCPIVESDVAGVAHLVLVDPATGEERLGPPIEQADEAWLDRWWPLDTPGQRAEVGRTRDALWQSLTSSVSTGLALAIDYSHSSDDRANDTLKAGTLAAYRDGSRVPPIPDGSCDLTAHVALDSCAATAETGSSLLTSQADALEALGVSSDLPPAEQAAADPGTYANSLSTATQARVLRDPAGLGAFGWLLHARGFDPNVLDVWRAMHRQTSNNPNAQAMMRP
jgi:SAM-dependent MidA family methyltransferase